VTDTGARDQEDVPILVASPGMSFDDVKAASTAELDAPRDPKGKWRAQPEEAHRFRLAHRALGFEVGPGLFTLVEAQKGAVVRIRTTAHADYVALPGALELVDALAEKLSDAGWEARLKPNPDRIAWGLGKTTEVRAGMWRPMPDIRAVVDPSAGWRADVYVRRAVDAGTDEAAFLQLEGGGYLVTLLVEDETAAP
jgi:hypothetical protein